MAGKKVDQDFGAALRGELACPECGGPMPSPIQVTVMGAGGVPRSYYVCRYCHRRRQRGKGGVGQVVSGLRRNDMR